MCIDTHVHRHTRTTCPHTHTGTRIATVLCSDPTCTLHTQLPPTHTPRHAHQEHTSAAPTRLQTALQVSRIHSTPLRGPHARPPAPAHPQHRPGAQRRGRSKGKAGPGACTQGATFLGVLSLCARLSGLGEGKEEAEPSRALLRPPPHAPWQGLQRERDLDGSDSGRLYPPLLASLLPTFPAAPGLTGE